MPIEVEVQRSLLDALQELSGAARRAGDDRIAARLSVFRETITDQKLRIAVLGEVGNGKSALISSLLGQPLLPMGIAPATRAMATVTHGPEDKVLLLYRDGARLEVGSDDLRDLGIEQVRRLEQVLVEAPSPLLDESIWVDAPGLQPSEGAEEDALQEVIARSECVLFVLNADRLLSITERDFLKDQVLTQDIKNIVFVLNRCDGKSAKDRDRLMDRARHLLKGSLPTITLFPYSALHSLQAGLKSDEAAAHEADPEGLQAFVLNEWLGKRSAILNDSIKRKLERISAQLEERLERRSQQSSASLQDIETRIGEAKAAHARAEERIDGICRRAITGLEAIQEQFGVGLKDFALTLRESVPGELMQVPVDDARRFLPFYIQDALKRAVDENDKPVRDAVALLVDGLSDQAGAALRPLLTRFQVEVEPPAIPLYLTRDRAPLSQGSTFVMLAASTLLFTQFYVGLLVLGSGIMSREVGRLLEAADRRAGLAASAQSLVHGSIETMERSIQEQFKELEDSVQAALRETFSPQMVETAATLTVLEELRESAQRETERVAELTSAGRAHLETATALLKGLSNER